MVFGIDYGTTSSSICYYESSKKQIVPLKVLGDNYTLPSVISIKDDKVHAGILLKGSTKVVKYPKRDLSIDNESAIINSYHLLKKLRTSTGRETIHAVVTIPVNYTNSQREATKIACNMAGINIIQLISEPTAIALGSNILCDFVLILDLGGGTVDLSLLEYDKENHIYQVVETGGDSKLGGEDINNLIIKNLGLEDTSENYLLVENAKKVLATRDFVDIAGYKLLGSELVMWCYDFFNKVYLLVKRFVDKYEISKVICAGGTSNLFGLLNFLEQKFPQIEFSKNQHFSELLVSIGACRYAVMKSDLSDPYGNEISLIDVTSLSLGVRDYEDIFIPIIPKNSVIPTKNSKLFTTSEEEELIEVEIFQGERKFCKDNFFVGKVVVKLDKKMKKGEAKIEVEFILDVSNTLVVNVKECVSSLSTNSMFKFTVSDEKVNEMLSKANQYKDVDKMREKECHLFSKACELISILSLHEDIVTGEIVNFYTEKLQEASNLEELINEISTKYPFVLVNHNLNNIQSSDVIDKFSQYESSKDDEELLILIHQVREKGDMSSDTATYLLYLEDQIKEGKELDVDLHKGVLTDLIYDYKEKYTLLVKMLCDNINNLELDEEKQKLLLEFIDKQNSDDYQKMTEELNKFCETLL